MNIDDYESLPTTSVAINMTAGAIAGVFEHIIMYPLDSVKTRMQSLNPVTANLNVFSTMQNMIKTEGIFRPIRGATAVVAGAGPAHALYFGSYEMTKELLTKVTKHNNINYMMSGVVATLIHDAVSNPTEVIKQRMQMYNSPYRSVIACVKDIYRKEGFKAFYRSYATQLVMNLPHQTIHFTTYECFQNMLNRERRYNPPVHVVAGGAAGASAAAITTPLDVVKTLLNTQETGFTKGMADAIKQIYTVAGPMGFFKGLTARVLYSMPATAICWSTYEFFKFYLCGMSRDTYKSSIIGKGPLQKPVDETAAYVVLPVVASETDEALALPSAQQSQQQQQTPTSTTPSIQPKETSHHAPVSPPTPSSTIKTVCELSSSVPAATLNMHTRHTDVKNPYDRGFRST